MPVIDTPRTRAFVEVLSEGPRGSLDAIQDPVVREYVRKRLQELGLGREEALAECAGQNKAAS